MNVQKALYQRRPTNYGRITGVITHLIRSVETTPMMVPAHVIKSLADLQLRQNRSRFGMMFLHNLDIKSSSLALLDIDDEDTADVLAVLKIRKKYKPRSRSPESRRRLSSVTYPLGEYPTWNAVQTAVRDEPWNVIRQYTELHLPLHIIVQRAFKAFTQQMWDNLNTAHLSDRAAPTVFTLESAMKAWSLGNVYDTIMKVSWEAINTGIWKNIRGPKEASFKERAKLYFPVNRGIASQAPGLHVFYALDTGYLSVFWRDIADLTDEELEDMYDELGEIFSAIQCLPSPRTMNVGDNILPAATWQIMHGSIRIVTNPQYYMIKGIGKDRAGQRGPRSSKAVISERDALKAQLEWADVPRTDMGRRLREALGRKSAKEKKQAKRKSGKSKNARIAPVRGRGSDTSGSSPSSRLSSSSRSNSRSRPRFNSPWDADESEGEELD